MTMPTSRDALNPLRPYYIPPSIGGPTDASAPNTTAYGIPSTTTSRPVASTPSKSFGTSARDILSDLDYGDYLPDSSPSSADVFKRLANQAVWKYTSVFLAQPFEVAKIILQCHLAASPEAVRRPTHTISRSSSVRSHGSRQPLHHEVIISAFTTMGW
jgi:mitochondrial fusion and transport protein UGO1